MAARYNVHNMDCIEGMESRITPGSVHLTVTSIPFEELFSYSGKVTDVGNNGSTVNVRAGRFALNLRFFLDRLLTVTAPGCNACIHIQQLLAYKNQHGFMGRRDFRGALIDLAMAAGWNYHGEVAIPKDPQVMAQRLSLHSLQFKTGHSRSSTQWAMAPNDYVLVFAKPGEVEVPVRPLVYSVGKKPTRRAAWFGANGTTDAQAYAGYLQGWAQEVDAINPTGWIGADDWIRWASGCWEDIDQFDVLDGARSTRALSKYRESEHEKHVCPLQRELIRRLILLYSNPASIQPDVLVLDPFMGIGSVGCVALEQGRNVVGFELKESYHVAALDNCRAYSRIYDEARAGGSGRTKSLYDEEVA